MSRNDLKDLRNMLGGAKPSAKRASRPAQSQTRSTTRAEGICTPDNLVLTRELKVECWRVIGEVAVGEQRDELHSLLLRADEMGETDRDDIAEHLLFEREGRSQVADRLLRIAENYRLIEPADDISRGRTQRYRLTDSGREALETKQVFVPEAGSWTVWVSRDPMLSSPVLFVEPFEEPAAREETGPNKAERQSREENFQTLPTWLQVDPQQPINVTLPMRGKANARINSLESLAERYPQRAGLTLCWEVSGMHLSVRGQIELSDSPHEPKEHKINSTLDLESPPTSPDVWQQLLAGIDQRDDWVSDERKLRVAFDSLDSAERSSMQCQLNFPAPEIDDCGQFDGSTVKQVGITARSSADARLWAEWRLLNGLNRYATSTCFDAAWDTASQPFATEFNLVAPERSELAHRHWPADGSRPNPQAWQLMAADDWSL